MQKTSGPGHLRVTLPALVAISILGGVSASIATGDPHWLNRFGALIAAFAAAAILIQISIEIQLERERERVEQKAEDLEQGMPIVMPIDALERRLELSQLENTRSTIAHHRLRVATFVVVSAMVGELLHGFGDLLMCYLVGVCASH